MKDLTRPYDRVVLLIGDVIILYASLWLTLLLRYQDIPSTKLFMDHVGPFSLIFLSWFVVFYLVGLYEKQTTIFKSKLPKTVLAAQIINIVIAALFFFFDPYFGISPKTNLLIYLAVSVVLVSTWRLYGTKFFLNRKSRTPALLVCDGAECQELADEINGNDWYPIRFSRTLSLRGEGIEDAWRTIQSAVDEDGIRTVVIDTASPAIQPFITRLYGLSFVGVRFFDFNKFYEEVFDRIPLSSLGSQWLLEYISPKPKLLHDAVKRTLDFVGAIVLGVLLLILLPILWPFVRNVEGEALISQERVGLGFVPIRVYKIATMRRNEAASDAWVKEDEERENRVTLIGQLLRKTSIDEFPQIWNIFKGELSFIGPRSDIAGLAERMADKIPFYSVRYLVTPGITGWAQVNQQYSPGNISPQSVEDTRLRLMYDLYYIKNRSLLLDLIIITKTFRVLLTRLFV